MEGWKEVVEAPVGTILHDEFDEGLRFIIMRGPAALCGYVGVPENHPLAGMEYDDVPVEAHGGLTFASAAKGSWPSGYYWYGWDYAHAGDYCVYDDKYNMPVRSEDKKWTLKDVKIDSWSTVWGFKKLMRLAEKITNKQTAAPHA